MGLVVEFGGDSVYLNILSMVEGDSHLLCECRLYDSWGYSRLGVRELGIRSFRIPRDSLRDSSFSGCYSWLRSHFIECGNIVVDL